MGARLKRKTESSNANGGLLCWGGVGRPLCPAGAISVSLNSLLEKLDVQVWVCNLWDYLMTDTQTGSTQHSFYSRSGKELFLAMKKLIPSLRRQDVKKAGVLRK